MTDSSTNFFKDVQNMHIAGGHFHVYNGPDSAPRTITYQQTTVNDQSRHKTNYGGYTNLGQHASHGGQINNGNDGYGHNSLSGRNYNSNNRFGERNPSPNSNYGYPRQVQGYSRRNRDAAQSEPNIFNQWPKQQGMPPRAKTERNRPTRGFDETDQFHQELESLSPQLRAHLEELRRNSSQNSSRDGMQNTSSDNRLPRSDDNLEQFDEADDYDHHESDDEEQQLDTPYSSYVHNDNRVITNNINSNNVHSEHIVDSYNDNSTRTEITKKSAK